jgi:hypothetical protein
VTRMIISTRERRGFEGGRIGWLPTTTLSWLMIAFLVAFVSAVAVLAYFGLGERGTSIALQVTARWSFLLFWFAYAGGALARVFGPRLAELSRRGRDFGLAFASSQLVHVGLVLWLIHVAHEPSGGMVFFWVGIVCTYLLALLSLPVLHDALEPRLRRILRTVAVEYIALVFVADFILIRLPANGLGQYPLSYLPFAFLLFAGAGLRVAGCVRQRFYSASDGPNA